MSLKLNTSPATVPSIGPPLYIFVPGPPFAVTRTNPLTFDPCCSSSNESSGEPLAVAALATLPYQVPVTSTVTRVLSIQSFCAQPELNRTVAAISTQVMIFMRYAGGGRAAIGSGPCGALLPGWVGV